MKKLTPSLVRALVPLAKLGFQGNKCLYVDFDDKCIMGATREIAVILHNVEGLEGTGKVCIPLPILHKVVNQKGAVTITRSRIGEFSYEPYESTLDPQRIKNLFVAREVKPGGFGWYDVDQLKIVEHLQSFYGEPTFHVCDNPYKNLLLELSDRQGNNCSIVLVSQNIKKKLGAPLYGEEIFEKDEE